MGAVVDGSLAEVTRDDLAQAFTNANVRAFSRVVRGGESSQDDRAYHMRFGGLGKAPAYFDSLEAHPRVPELTTGGRTSTAAGAYEATWTTWSEEQAKYGWPGFSEQEQDEFFVARLVYRRALDAVIAGRFYEACRLCKSEWTSLPGGSEENAATKHAAQVFLEYGGEITDSPSSPVSEVKPMAPLILPLLEIAASFIPQLGKMFGSGTEVQQRNVAAASMVADTLIKTTQAVNLQDAVEKIQSDPQVLNDAKEAVAKTLFEIGEAGGGGIKAARDAAAATEGDWRKLIFSGPFVLALLLLPLIYAVVGAALLKFEWLAEMTSEVRAGVIGSVTGLVLGSLVGYFYGTSASSAKKDAALGAK
jgi:muramidase (phage lysozyme)